MLETKKIGTMAEVRILCANPKCQKRENVWRSQPQMEGTRIPAGNLLLSFAILLAGGTATKVLRIFDHMGLACISLKTFFKHQRVSSVFFTLLGLGSFLASSQSSHNPK